MYGCADCVLYKGVFFKGVFFRGIRFIFLFIIIIWGGSR